MGKGYTNWTYHGEPKERQSKEYEEAESHVGLAIRLCKDTHFKEQIGRAHEKAKRNYSSQVSQNSDGASPIKNDVEIVQNQLGIEHGFVVTNRQRASSSRKRVKVAEERSLQPAEEVTKLLEKLDKMRRCFSSNCSSRHHGSSNINGLHQIPNSSRPRQAGISRRHQHGGNISTTHEHHHNHHLNE
ncbi:uncharacterized protein LOC132300323 isoform X2 [Cornus florida]|nr:uncharacterized protein LOC132300323 isoform X2 [Cornus florida]